MADSLTYPSGERVLKGDRIRYAGSAGVVEFLPDAADPKTAWYAEQGGACMIRTEAYGLILFHSTHDEEDLEFVSRSDG
jgi:hypothetical protein